MPERTKILHCAEDGCRGTAIYSYANQREYTEIMLRQKRSPYKCTRHQNPEQVLSPDNVERTRVLIAVKVRFKNSFTGKEFLDGLFWQEEGAERAGSGFTYGPGFKAHASDFPEGTRLVVTAHIELPDDPSHAAGRTG